MTCKDRNVIQSPCTPADRDGLLAIADAIRYLGNKIEVAANDLNVGNVGRGLSAIAALDSKPIADGLDHIAYALHQMGNGDATTTVGGLEGLGMAVKDGLGGLADGLHQSEINNTENFGCIAESIDGLADALRERAMKGSA